MDRYTRTAILRPRGRTHATAQFMEQFQELLLLMRLSLVIGRPILRICLTDGLLHGDSFGNGRRAICVALTEQHVLNGDDMFASAPPILMVWAGAMRFLRVEADRIAALA